VPDTATRCKYHGGGNVPTVSPAVIRQSTAGRTLRCECGVTMVAGVDHVCRREARMIRGLSID
jgi:hypothetical protein